MDVRPIFRTQITAGGGTVNFTESFGDYHLYTTAPVALAGSWTFTIAGVPILYELITVYWDGQVTLGAWNISILGNVLTQDQVGTQGKMEFYYNGATWDYRFYPDFENDNIVKGSKLVNAEVTNAKLANLAHNGIKIGDLTNRPTDLVCAVDHALLTGNISGGETLAWKTLTGDVTGVSSPGLYTVTIANDAVTNAKLANITRGSVKVGGVADAPTDLAITVNHILAGDGVDAVNSTVAGDLSLVVAAGVGTFTVLTTELITAVASFETNEVGDFSIRMPFKGTVNHCRATVNKVIAGVDNGTITLFDNGMAAMTGTPLTIVAASALNTTVQAAVTANNTFNAGDVITIRSAKATVGGRCQLSISCLRTV